MQNSIQNTDQNTQENNSLVLLKTDTLDAELETAIETILLRYFETINRGDFSAAVALFSPIGVLYPPFEKAIVGRKAIAHYLKTEATGFQLFPSQGKVQVLEPYQIHCQVIGSVKTPYFSVGVGWGFHLICDAESSMEIASVHVNLLAKLEELLHLR